MNRKIYSCAYWALALLTFVGTAAMIFWWTPQERTMGIIQKIFYFHLPLAINTFVACTVCFVGGIGYLVHSWTVPP